MEVISPPAPYGGFVNPVLVPNVDAGGEITSIEVNYVKSFVGQMLNYSANYGFLPEVN